jgi:hypothetical protein
MKTAAGSSVPDQGEQARIREVQQLAYRTAEGVARELRPGITERQAAARLKRRLIEEGVEDWFHIPFAWFGDRTTLKGFRNRFKVTYQVVNLDRLAELFPAGSEVGPAELAGAGAVRKGRPVKVLGDGDLGGVALRVSAHAFSASAKEKIAAAGGTTTVLE